MPRETLKELRHEKTPVTLKGDTTADLSPQPQPYLYILHLSDPMVRTVITLRYGRALVARLQQLLKNLICDAAISGLSATHSHSVTFLSFLHRSASVHQMAYVHRYGVCAVSNHTRNLDVCTAINIVIKDRTLWRHVSVKQHGTATNGGRYCTAQKVLPASQSDNVSRRHHQD